VNGVILIVALWVGFQNSVQCATVPPTNSASRPPVAQLQSQARRCRDILRNNLINFYLPASVDSINGGYMEALDAGGQFGFNGEKFLVLQARQLWFFSTLVTEKYESARALSAARIGYSFITQMMRDPQNGGYYSKVTDTGAIKDARKHAYLQASALYGLTAYYRATREAGVLQAAQQLFQVLETRAYDRVNGGYHEFFYPNWQVINDPRESSYVGAIGTKTYNTHLHLMEAFADLYKLWPDELLRRRLQELITINANTVRAPTFDCNVDAFMPNWQVVQNPKNMRVSYGHDVECAWLALETLAALQQPTAPYRSWAESICRTSLNFGFDRNNGGFFSSGPLGAAADDTSKIFWVESESLISMLAMYRLTGAIEYYDAFSKTLNFVEKFQIAPEGGWWSVRQADGSPSTNMLRSSSWQGAYHPGRAMMVSARWLDELARK
jgi:mannobiose 2-epimerase